MKRLLFTVYASSDWSDSVQLNLFLFIWHRFITAVSVYPLIHNLVLLRTSFIFCRLPYRKGKKKRDRSPSSSSSSSSQSPYPPPFRGKEYMGEGMEHPEEGFSHTRYPPRDYAGPGDRGPRDYEGHGMERGRGRGFVSSLHLWMSPWLFLLLTCIDMSSSCDFLS